MEDFLHKSGLAYNLLKIKQTICFREFSFRVFRMGIMLYFLLLWYLYTAMPCHLKIVFSNENELHSLAFQIIQYILYFKSKYIHQVTAESFNYFFICYASSLLNILTELSHIWFVHLKSVDTFVPFVFSTSFWIVAWLI